MGGGGGGGWKDLRADQGSVMRDGRSLTSHGGCFLIIVVGNKNKKYLIE